VESTQRIHHRMTRSYAPRLPLEHIILMEMHKFWFLMVFQNSPIMSEPL
jgi:hypothetical protein